MSYSHNNFAADFARRELDGKPERTIVIVLLSLQIQIPRKKELNETRFTFYYVNELWNLSLKHQCLV